MEPIRTITPEQTAMQSLCKQLLKSRLFRGYYSQRCYVDSLGDYRDVIALEHNEVDFEKQLLNVKEKLQMLYLRTVPNIWIGISKGTNGNYNHVGIPRALDTCVWTKLNALAFGEYWFSIKTVKFKANEVLLKLKTVRAVEVEGSVCKSVVRSPISLSQHLQQQQQPPDNGELVNSISKVKMEDFNLLLQQWGDNIKYTIYNFMVNDINKTNIISALKFIALLVVSVLCGAAYALRFLGTFTLRFMFELSRFTHVATPIILKFIEMLSKCIGGILLFFTIIWKDLIGARSRTRQQFQPSLEYNS